MWIVELNPELVPAELDEKTTNISFPQLETFAGIWCPVISSISLPSTFVPL